MIQDYDDYVPPEEEEEQRKVIISVPDLDNEFVRAKTFLQTGSSATGDNLYDHLTDVLNKILAERPENVIDFFEEYSRKVKEKRFRPLTDHLEDIYVHPPRYKLCKKLQPLLLPMGPDEPSTMDPEDMDMADLTQLNMMQLLYYFEQAGIGLPKVEMFSIMLSIMRFVKKEPVNSVRFWGKIYGDYKNYLVLETELKDEALIKKHEAAQEEELKITEESEMMSHDQQVSFIMESAGEDASTAVISRPLPPIPKCPTQSVQVIPEEPSGTGINKKAYYVCNEIGDDWIQLPDVTPQQIVVARQIRKTITGNLDQTISTYPEFPGKEVNYLRVQIARISAGTQISPLGYYTFSEEGGEGDDEAEDEEEEQGRKRGAGKTSFTENRKFDGVPLRDMLDPSMAFWVHHSMYILPQGRTTWWNPQSGEEIPGEDMEGEGDDEGGKPRKPGSEPEIGPPLLTALSEDSSLEAVAAWSVRASSTLQPNFALAVVRSNIWPGAYCIATQGKLFQNIYLGDGLKFNSHNYSPKPLPPVQQEYTIGPDVMEMSDPTGAEEEAWRIAHLPKEKSGGGDEELEEEVEEEEENDEEDDDD